MFLFCCVFGTNNYFLFLSYGSPDMVFPRVELSYYFSRTSIQFTNISYAISYAKASLLLQRVQLSFVSFGLEANSNCSYDNVSIYDGTDRSAPLLGTFCGESLPDAVTSSDNTMIVRFKTDRSETRSGFSIYYSVSIPVDGMCIVYYFT